MALPQGFKKPEGNNSSNFTEIVSGENRLRVLTEFITGNKYWTGDERKGEDRKPVFKRIDETIDLSQLGYGKYGDDKVMTFIAGVVWNYETKKIEIFETDKWGIVGDIFDLEHDEEWGDVCEYDIKIIKSGVGKETRYKVNPTRPLPVAKEIIEEFNAKDIDLEKLFDGGYPMEQDLASEVAEALK